MKNFFNLKQPNALSLLGLLAISSLVVSSTSQVQASNTNSPENEVTVELVLAVDVSGSVNAQEFDLQLQGYKSAFENAEV